MRELVLSIALQLGVVFAGATPAFAATHDKTWSWDEILAPPMREPEPYDCNATHPVRAIPDFGDGLVATYTFEVGSESGQTVSDRIDDFARHTNHAVGDARMAKLTIPKAIPPVGGSITVEDNVVLTSMDDLLNRYTAICNWNRTPPLVLQSITYRPASLRERAEAPARESWYYLPDLPIPPLSVQIIPGEPDLLPAPVAGGDYHFATSFDPLPAASGLVPMQEGYRWPFDPSKVAIGNGVHLAALFLGHNNLGAMEPLTDDGFDVLTIEDGGLIETLVIDRHVLVSADELATRTNQVMRYQSFETELRLTRLEFYPAVLGGIDALRTDQGRDLKDQVAKRHGLELAEGYIRLMSYLPQNEDTEPLLKAEWSKFAGSTTGSGYDAIFGAPGSTFGKLENISCEPDDAVFDCKVGVTFTADGHPKYAQRALYFERLKRESERLELEPADPRAPIYDPLRATAPAVEPTIATGVNAMPTIPEVQQLFAAGWTHAPASIFTGNLQDIGDMNFASEFADYGDLSATFGEVHDLACTEKDSVFACTVGVTYMLDRVPRYGQYGHQLFQRVRDADGDWKLRVYLETYIIVPDAVRTQPPRQ